jgi:3D (Asp-Asp-Asp) domain-containing protein
MRNAHVVLTALALLVTSLSATGCAGTRSSQTASLTPATKKAQEDTSLGRLDDPNFLFRKRGKTKSLVVKALAYTGCSGKAKRSPRGAWGDPLTPDIKAVAVSPDLLHLGLEYGDAIKIEGLPGEYKVLDLMHSRHAKAIDIFYGDDRCGARQWGSRTLTITWQ